MTVWLLAGNRREHSGALSPPPKVPSIVMYGIPERINRRFAAGAWLKPIGIPIGLTAINCFTS